MLYRRVALANASLSHSHQHIYGCIRYTCTRDPSAVAPLYPCTCDNLQCTIFDNTHLRTCALCARSLSALLYCTLCTLHFGHNNQVPFAGLSPKTESSCVVPIKASALALRSFSLSNDKNVLRQCFFARIFILNRTKTKTLERSPSGKLFAISLGFQVDYML